MARKEITVDIQDRDNTWTFRIKEMPATKLESWMTRAALLLAGSGSAALPQETGLKEAWDALAEKGLDLGTLLSALGQADYDKAKPLLDELLTCCSRVLGSVEERCTPETVDGYIEDVATLVKLRWEAAKLNLSFLAEGLGNLSASQAK